MREPIDFLVPRMQARLFHAALSVCRDRQEAENIVQDVFQIYFDSAKEFESQAHLEAWLLRCAVNRAKDARRAFRRRSRIGIDCEASQIPFEMPQDRSVFEAVMQLKENQRIVIYLHYYEDKPVREIARILGSRENTVKSHLRRAKMALKTLLQEEWNDDEP